MNKGQNKNISKHKRKNRIDLTQDQINLIELAFLKQVPPEDAAFIEKVKKGYKKDDEKIETTFNKLTSYFINKYGNDFGILLLSAITGGEKEYKRTKKSIEELNTIETTRYKN